MVLLNYYPSRGTAAGTAHYGPWGKSPGKQTLNPGSSPPPAGTPLKRDSPPWHNLEGASWALAWRWDISPFQAPHPGRCPLPAMATIFREPSGSWVLVVNLGTAAQWGSLRQQLCRGDHQDVGKLHPSAPTLGCTWGTLTIQTPRLHPQIIWIHWSGMDTSDVQFVSSPGDFYL